MNAVTIVIASMCILAIAYRLYGTFMMVKVLKVNDDKPTPAHSLEDGKDYVPTNKWVSFGHHFAAIAAAGPLVGPILAAQFGYLPGLLWLLIGAVIGGAVHDIVVLFASMRKTENRCRKWRRMSLALLQDFVQDCPCCLSSRSQWRACRWLSCMRLNVIHGEHLR